MQRRYPPGRPDTGRRGPSDWRGRGERGLWSAGERDTPNYDESLLPDDEYDPAFRFAREDAGLEDWDSEMSDRTGRAPLDAPRRREPEPHGAGGGLGGPRGYGGERGDERTRGEAGRGYYSEADPRGRRGGYGTAAAYGRYSGYGDYGRAAGAGAPSRRAGAHPDERSRFAGPDYAARRRQGPKGYTRSDERIREDVCERLAAALDIDVSDVSVQVREGCVELDGTVPARWMKHGIEDIADSCVCVRDVENRVRVRREDEGGAGGERHDRVLRPDQRTVTPTPNANEDDTSGPSSGASRH